MASVGEFSAYNYKNWPYVDSPWDLLEPCREVELGLPESSQTKCVISSILGNWSAYVLPSVCSVGLVGSVAIAVALFAHPKRLTRQVLFISFMLLGNAGTNVSFAWFWMFPAKGLPFVTNGTVYYFMPYDSFAACLLFRSVYSFTSTMSVNFLLLASVDRFMIIYFPVKYATMSKRYGWYVSGCTILLSIVLIIPVTAQISLHYVGDKLICWFNPHNTFMEIYHIMISNCAVVQPLLTGVFNLAFFIRIRRTILKRSSKNWTRSERAQVRASLLLLILSAIYLLFSAPQTIAYIAAFILSKKNNGVDSAARLAYNIADIGWNLYFLRELANILVLFWFNSIIRQLFLSLFPRIPKSWIVTDVETTVTTGKPQH
ncbi:hypothetical protein T265_09931 [Opisthorchis viverrini]|uniref:G-protein coupled receptors family 1 profile domain-containing protein n=1 Tax=Opisthorchis viverrini TaxID=6198 RepID=A0A074Z423_OPIVI|nr:hypothetical protein T265_09931 [Opisthorchis viverrini]KER21836.1 hypothetical protein T265_09931 [Opisthorchis viverrini]